MIEFAQRLDLPEGEDLLHVGILLLHLLDGDDFLVGADGLEDDSEGAVAEGFLYSVLLHINLILGGGFSSGLLNKSCDNLFHTHVKAHSELLAQDRGRRNLPPQPRCLRLPRHDPQTQRLRHSDRRIRHSQARFHAIRHQGQD